MFNDDRLILFNIVMATLQTEPACEEWSAIALNTSYSLCWILLDCLFPMHTLMSNSEIRMQHRGHEHLWQIQSWLPTLPWCYIIKCKYQKWYVSISVACLQCLQCNLYYWYVLIASRYTNQQLASRAEHLLSILKLLNEPHLTI